MKTDLSEEQRNLYLKLFTKLQGLGIEAHFAGIEEGPVVTGFYFKPSASLTVRKFLSLSEDLALATDSDKVNIQRIGGFLVLFVPNATRSIVDFKDYLHWYLTNPEVAAMELAIPLGVDHRGSKMAFDLVDAPHVLIAGSTGSGKSVFEAAILSCLAYSNASVDVEFYLVDTKKVDLPLFKQLAHTRVVADDLDLFHTMMGGVMTEVRRRLTILQGASCRKIQDYHKLGYPMPYMVVMMDEFGDLMELDYAARKALKDKYETIPSVKSWIKSLVQIGRAAGVHLIACTQRSSVKVVDGDIKANLPTRIALRLPTGTDSRTILGANGAENLLGKGDMLIQRPESDIIERYHGPFVSMNDITNLVVNYEDIVRMYNK